MRTVPRVLRSFRRSLGLEDWIMLSRKPMRTADCRRIRGLLAFLVICVVANSAQANHRVVLVDMGHLPTTGSNSPPQLRLVDTDSGEVLASVQIPGYAPDLAVSSDRTLVAVLSGTFNLDVFDTKTLARVGTGRLPF